MRRASVLTSHIDCLTGWEQAVLPLQSAQSRGEKEELFDGCWVCHDFLSAAEVRALVDKASRTGFSTASHNYPLAYRTNERLVVDCPALASRLFERAQQLAKDEGEEVMMSSSSSTLNITVRTKSDGKSDLLHLNKVWLEHMVGVKASEGGAGGASGGWPRTPSRAWRPNSEPIETDRYPALA